MSKRFLISVSLLLATVVTPSPAVPPEIQLVGTSIANDRIVFQVGNTGASERLVCVEVLVRLSNGSTQLLTTSTATVPGSSTSTVSGTAAGTIVEIVDDPQPVAF